MLPPKVSIDVSDRLHKWDESQRKPLINGIIKTHQMKPLDPWQRPKPRDRVALSAWSTE